MKNIYYLLLVSFIFSFSNTKVAAQNSIKAEIGKIPYEMEGRIHPKFDFDFTTCSLWELKSNNCDVSIIETREKIVTTPISGKITYVAKEKKASFDLVLKTPIVKQKLWDCVEVWTYGDHWLWGEPVFTTAFQIYVLYKDAKGNEYEVNMVNSGYAQLAHKYWFLNHLKIGKESEGKTFLGFRFKGSNLDVGVSHNLYMSSGRVFKEKLGAIDLKPFPKKLPFPVCNTTILPTNKTSNYNNSINEVEKGIYNFSYVGDDTKIDYKLSVNALLSDVKIFYNDKIEQILRGREIVLDNDKEAKFSVVKHHLSSDTLHLSCYISNYADKPKFNCWYTIKQKSLIFGIEQDGSVGCIKRFNIGNIKSKKAKVVKVPILNFNYGTRPYIVCDANLFNFAMFDWYKSNTSIMYPGKVKGDVFSLGGVEYIPKTDGHRNKFKEVLFFNTSPDVHEVFPTISNPASAMRSFQADRFWAIDGSTDLDYLAKQVREYRFYGIDKMSIRYHEGFWRAGGESYTFKTTPNPDMPIEDIKRHVKYVQSLGWRVGFYTNYTDFAPVNAKFNPDWVMLDQAGSWSVSWSRCYAPKPQIAWEQQLEIAPSIKKMFDTNFSYCDVHTAVSPMSRIDYDARVPDAGMMRHVIERYGMILLNEKAAYDGPVYSEGANHWWYAGLVDGNYGNDTWTSLPVFPDFNLLKVNPLEMDAANLSTTNVDEYIAHALTYANIGQKSDLKGTIRRYAVLQPLQNDYVMVDVKSISYYDDNKEVSPSEAVRCDLIKSPRLRIVYKSGLQVYVNHSKAVWKIKCDGKELQLPTWGYYAYNPTKNLCASSSLQQNKRVKQTYSDHLYYINSDGLTINGKLGGRGEYMLKKEEFSWEIIPISDSCDINFDLSLIGLEDKEVKLIPVNIDGPIHDSNLIFRCKNKVELIVSQPGVKYKIIPIRSL